MGYQRECITCAVHNSMHNRRGFIWASGWALRYAACRHLDRGIMLYFTV